MASEIETGEVAEAPSSQKDQLELKDGTVLVGKILEETDELVILESESLGRLEISRSQIKILSRSGEPRLGVPGPSACRQPADGLRRHRRRAARGRGIP